MKIFFLKDEKRIPEVVDIHIRTFQGFFLTFLGKGFLKHLYSEFVAHSKSNLIVAQDESGKLVGFLAYSKDISGFYKTLIHKKLFQLGWYSFIAFLKNPRIIFRILRAFIYPSNAKRNEQYIELSSIGVLPEVASKGIGTKMIDFLKVHVDFTVYKYIKLETDAKKNDEVNRFYISKGFILEKTYLTPEGRVMNEYHYTI